MKNNMAQTQAIQAADVLDSGSAIDIRAVAANFVRKRLNNATSIEDIKQQAIEKLRSKLQDPEADFKPHTLLAMVETLGDQSAVDLSAILKSQEGGKAGGKQSTVSVFFGVPPETAPGAVPMLGKEAYAVLDKLVVAADAVLRSPPPRVVEAVSAAVVKKQPAKKPAAKKVVAKKAPVKNAKPKPKR